MDFYDVSFVDGANVPIEVILWILQLILYFQLHSKSQIN
jgi:hypothetical protein